MVNNFTVFISSFSGSYNYGTDAYDNDPNKADLTKTKVYTDNGIGQIFDSKEFNNVIGQFAYSDNKASIKLDNQTNVLSVVSQYAFYFPNGIINALGSVYNGTDQDGYPNPGTTQLYNIIGGSGDFFNVK
jgi:hypothetical protein